ncbi:46 kDa FK506-binding nuclear protein-like [Belonocnema kinseyi]|uniref:46 kDa FK506-binding nuclear protein-like n=1 Tax=Belonocnema kinseyi TaxID=2817044 RepID=UPI00143D47E3|nr:46 kDa FK506-binding nuclear protein-like [Belonocnema kinseyi]
MFWGLIMEPNKRYSQLVERSFHLSMASLDVTGANDQPVQVMLCYENRNYLLCTLKKGTIFQVPLDLNFQEGTKIAFTCNGFGHVHLTGYLTLDEDLDFGDLEEEEEEDEEEAPQLVKPKRKAVESPAATKASKKLKKQANDDEDSSEDDDDDLDMDAAAAAAESDSDDEDQTKLVEADDDEEESEDDDSDDEDEDDDSEDEAEPEQQVAKSNKKKQKQQAQNQAGKKQEKQKLVNGKDSSKLDLSKQKKNKSEQQQQQQQQQQNSQQTKRRTIEGGVLVEDLVVGNGAPAKPGRAVTVYYTGRLKNGKKFDETRQGDGFKFQLGKGEVIKGWDVGISGMKIGGKRRLTIPAAMGYGNKGSPPVIPGNSTLIFDVELKKVH